MLASAFEAIDSGYYSFILEELSHQQAEIQELADAALTIFRSQSMTNNSLYEKSDIKKSIWKIDSSSLKYSSGVQHSLRVSPQWVVMLTL